MGAGEYVTHGPFRPWEGGGYRKGSGKESANIRVPFLVSMVGGRGSEQDQTEQQKDGGVIQPSRRFTKKRAWIERDDHCRFSGGMIHQKGWALKRRGEFEKGESKTSP